MHADEDAAKGIDASKTASVNFVCRGQRRDRVWKPDQTEADNRRSAVFFCPHHAVPSMGGSGREASACWFPLSPVFQPCHLPPHLVWKRGNAV